jgi:hypothetical protein
LSRVWNQTLVLRRKRRRLYQNIATFEIGLFCSIMKNIEPVCVFVCTRVYFFHFLRPTRTHTFTHMWMLQASVSCWEGSVVFPNPF